MKHCDGTTAAWSVERASETEGGTVWRGNEEEVNRKERSLESTQL